MWTHTNQKFPRTCLLHENWQVHEQVQQKTQCDRHARDPGFRVGDSVFVLMLAKRLAKAQVCKTIFQIHIPVFSKVFVSLYCWFQVSLLCTYAAWMQTSNSIHMTTALSTRYGPVCHTFLSETLKWRWQLAGMYVLYACTKRSSQNTLQIM